MSTRTTTTHDDTATHIYDTKNVFIFLFCLFLLHSFQPRTDKERSILDATVLFCNSNGIKLGVEEGGVGLASSSSSSSKGLFLRKINSFTNFPTLELFESKPDSKNNGKWAKYSCLVHACAEEVLAHMWITLSRQKESNLGKRRDNLELWKGGGFDFSSGMSFDINERSRLTYQLINFPPPFSNRLVQEWLVWDKVVDKEDGQNR